MRSSSSSSSSSSWKVVLLIDRCELQYSKGCSLDEFVRRLQQQHNIPCQVRSLPTGDYLWVAQQQQSSSSSSSNYSSSSSDDDNNNDNNNNNNNNNNSSSSSSNNNNNNHNNHNITSCKEVVLDWIIERKTLRNLHVSLCRKSKKFLPLTQIDAQLHKMKFSGVRNRILMVERGENGRGIDQNQHDMINGFLFNLKKKDTEISIHHTMNVDRSIHYLVKMHNEISMSFFRSRNGDEFKKEDSSSSKEFLTINTIKKNIKEKLNDPNFQWYLTLRRINKVSEKRYGVLKEYFPTKESMVCAFRSNKEGALQQIAKMKQPDGMRSSFGKKLAQSIYDGVVGGSVLANSSNTSYEPSCYLSDSDDSSIPPPSPFAKTADSTKTGKYQHDSADDKEASSASEDFDEIPPPSPFFKACSANINRINRKRLEKPAVAAQRDVLQKSKRKKKISCRRKLVTTPDTIDLVESSSSSSEDELLHKKPAAVMVTPSANSKTQSGGTSHEPSQTCRRPDLPRRLFPPAPTK